MLREALALVAGIAVVFLSACASSADPDAVPASEAPIGLSFLVSETTFTTGDTIRLTLRNDSDDELGYNLCLADLQRRDDGEWVSAQRMPENTACAAMLRLLKPGEAVTETQPVHPFIQPGVYRFRDEVEWPVSGDRFTVISNGFSIVE